MFRFSADLTVIIIAHRLSTIQSADRIAVINQGEVVQVISRARDLSNGTYSVQLGSHDDLMAKAGELYETLVSKQMSAG